MRWIRDNKLGPKAVFDLPLLVRGTDLTRTRRGSRFSTVCEAGDFGMQRLLAIRQQLVLPAGILSHVQHK